MLTNSNNTCSNSIRIQSSEVSGTDFTLTSNSLVTPVNGHRYILIIPASVLPTDALLTVNQVYVSIDGQNVPLQCMIGNNVYTDQFKCFCVNSCGNIVLRVIFGSTPAHFKIISQRLCSSTAYSETAAVAVSESNG